MNILCSVTYFDPYISGLSIYAKRLAQGLAAKDHRVTVLAMSGQARSLPRSPRLSPGEAGRPASPNRGEQAGRLTRQVEVIVAKPLIKISKGFLSLDWIVKSWQQVTSHDVLVVHLPQAEGWIPALLARLLGKRVISIYHCEVLLPDGFLNSTVQTFLEIANTITLFLSHTVVTYTKDYADHSRLLSLVKDKVVAIYPPISQPIVLTNQVSRFKKQIGKSDVVIGVAARLAAEKGIEYLLEALPMLEKKLPKQILKIVIAGSVNPVGEEAYKIQIMQRVQKYKKYIVFLGEIASENMGSFYRCIDVLVVPSINSTEAFGLVQVEAMMMGIPVVASDLPGVRVPIQKTGMGIVVPPRNSNALAYAISRTIRGKQKEPTIQKVKRVFNYEKVLTQWDRLLSQ